MCQIRKNNLSLYFTARMCNNREQRMPNITKLKQCQFCEQNFGVRQMRKHLPKCEKKVRKNARKPKEPTEA